MTSSEGHWTYCVYETYFSMLKCPRLWPYAEAYLREELEIMAKYFKARPHS